jgi:hypothetical protein
MPMRAKQLRIDIIGTVLLEAQSMISRVASPPVAHDKTHVALLAGHPGPATSAGRRTTPHLSVRAPSNPALTTTFSTDESRLGAAMEPADRARKYRAGLLNTAPVDHAYSTTASSRLTSGPAATMAARLRRAGC